MLLEEKARVEIDKLVYMANGNKIYFKNIVVLHLWISDGVHIKQVKNNCIL